MRFEGSKANAGRDEFVMKRVASFSFLLAVSLLTPPAAGADEFSGARALGMADALIAAPTGAAALALNPAGMSLISGYVIEGAYLYEVRRSGHGAHVSVVDSITSKRVAAGIYYNFLFSQPKLYVPGTGETKLSKQGHQTGLAVSVPLGDRFILGANVGYLYHKTSAKVYDPLEDKRKDVEVERLNTVGVDVGAIFRAASSGDNLVNIGLVGTNLVPTKSLEAPLALGVGVAYGFKKFLIADFDVVLNFDVDDRKKMVDFHGGVEGFIAGQFAIRGGAVHKMYWQSTYVTAGFGYVNPKVALEIAYGQQVQGGVESQIALSLRFFLN